MTFADLRLRLRALVRPGRAERDLHDEIAFHLDMQARKHRRAGAAADEAERLARVRFGSTALAAERCRDVRGLARIETLWQDARYAVRSFRRAPTFALTVVGTIAIGLGLNTAVFTIFNTYVLKPLDVRDPYALYEMVWTARAGNDSRFTWADYLALRADRTVFSEVLAEGRPMMARIDGSPAFGFLVSGNYFRMLGVDAALGRTLDPDDAEAPGRSPVVVVSHAYWLRHFGGDPAVVGRKMLVQGHPCEIVGVARKGFDGLELPPADLWLPVTLEPALQDGASLFGPEQPRRLTVVGRLQPSMTPETAAGPLLLWMQNATRHLPGDDQARAVRLTPRATSLALSPLLMFVLSPVIVAFALVLLIACANVANMMLARGMARQREIGIRMTIGAGRARLVAQLLMESLLLAIPAAVAGFVISRAAIDAGVRALFATMPTEFTDFMRVAPLPPDGRVFTFMIVAAVATSVLFGLAPALQATRAGVVQMARGDFGSDFGSSRLRSLLVVAQITAAALLLITAAVLVRSTQRFAAVDVGLRTRDVISIDIAERARARVLDALAVHPVVIGVASTSAIPMSQSAPSVGASAVAGGSLVRLRYRFVSPSYFDVLGLPLVAGRTFTNDEADSGAAVAILSAAAAQRLWPGESPIGRLLPLTLPPRSRAAAEIRRFTSARIVGIARDTAADLANDGPMPEAIHFPASMRAAGSGILVRITGEPEAARRTLDAALGDAAPGGVQQIHKLQEFIAGRLYPFRAAYWVAAAVGLLALLLTISGVYGVLSYLVAQRTKELAIRLALGAPPRSVVVLVLRQSIRLAACGLALGAACALAASRAFASRVLLVNVFDASAYTAGILIVGAACIAAAGVPAIRAARLDPMTMLRTD
jgi:predicted permease